MLPNKSDGKNVNVHGVCHSVMLSVIAVCNTHIVDRLQVEVSPWMHLDLHDLRTYRRGFRQPDESEVVVDGIKLAT